MFSWDLFYNVFKPNPVSYINIVITSQWIYDIIKKKTKNSKIDTGLKDSATKLVNYAKEKINVTFTISFQMKKNVILLCVFS